MNTPIPINASKARDEFFKILDRVYFEDVEFVVRKTGIPVAKISKSVSIKPKKKLIDFFGILSDIEAEKIKKYIYEGRKDKGKLKRKLPQIL